MSDIENLGVLHFVKGDDLPSIPGLSQEGARDKVLEEKEIILKRLEGKFRYKHTCGIVTYFDKELSPEYEEKFSDACPCTNPKTKGLNLYICGLGHWELSRYSTIVDWSCKECQKLWNVMTPEEIRRRTAYRQKIPQEVKFPSGKELEAEIKKLEREDLAKAIAKELKNVSKQTIQD